ncbi:MAG: diguanylate cyclase [Spirochaetales bacterium]|nr:diguanylate cyclase [Spirochaetales bacterium]
MKSSYEMLYALPQGIFCVDSEFRILFWNQRMEIWTGRSSADAEGMDVRDIFPSLRKKFYSLMVKQVFDSGSTALFSYQLHKDLFPFEGAKGNAFCIQSQVVRSHSPDLPNEIIAVFSLQDISSLVNQIQQTNEAKDQVMELLEKMKKTEEELRISNEELKKAASTDPLTGLNNRRSMMKIIGNEEIRHNRYNNPFSLILTDIDGFKKFNDTFGHGCGDYILKHLGALFNSLKRPSDAVCRWGGEEFLILLPETDIVNAGRMAERLRSAVEQENFDFEGKTHKVTMTFGVSSIEVDTNAARMIVHADEALYHGKNNGKNRVVLNTELPDSDQSDSDESVLKISVSELIDKS